MGQFDHERLVVYRLALDFDVLVVGLLPKRGGRIIRDQLERASLGIVLNIAEGAGRRSPPDKRHFYAVARGSATESAAILDILRSRKVLNDESYDHARSLLETIVRILSRLSTPPPEPELELEPRSQP
jgi:four helix bundle protein